jgi:hypothetical protein
MMVWIIFQVGLSLDETVEREDLKDLLEIFGSPDSMVRFQNHFYNGCH